MFGQRQRCRFVVQFLVWSIYALSNSIFGRECISSLRRQLLVFFRYLDHETLFCFVHSCQLLLLSYQLSRSNCSPHSRILQIVCYLGCNCTKLKQIQRKLFFFSFINHGKYHSSLILIVFIKLTERDGIDNMASERNHFWHSKYCEVAPIYFNSSEQSMNLFRGNSDRRIDILIEVSEDCIAY